MMQGRPRGRGELEAQLVKILKQNPENSHETRRQRFQALREAAEFLAEKYGLLKLRNLKPKHVEALVEHWKASESSRGTIQNKLSHLRWLADKLGKTRLIPESNRDLGIETRERHTRAGKTIGDERLSRIVSDLADPKARLMVLMGRHFGMRFKEAALFRPHMDVSGRMVWLKRGTKGGKPRYVWMVSPEQEAVIAAARKLVAEPRGCLVDQDKTYIHWKRSMYRKLQAAGLSRSTDEAFHDLRRTFAVREIDRLVAKGMSRADAAKNVAKKLGHNRVEVIRWYVDMSGSEEEPAA